MEVNFIVAIILFAIFPIGFIGNAIVLVVLLRQRKSWPVSLNYLFNLALADFAFLCTIPFWGYTYLTAFDWKFGEVMCKLVAAMTTINMFASIFCLTALAFDRWLAIVHVFKSRQYRTTKIARWVSVSIWCSSLILSTPRLAYQMLVVPRYDSNITGNLTGDHSAHNATTLRKDEHFTALEHELLSLSKKDRENTTSVCLFSIPSAEASDVNFAQGLVYIINSLFGFIIPFVVISVCYVKIYISIKQKAINKAIKQDRIAKISAAVIIAFFVCWLPQQALNVYYATTKYWKVQQFSDTFFQSVYSFAICLAWGNSCINPILYAFTGTQFRESCGNLLCGRLRNFSDFRRSVLYHSVFRSYRIQALSKIRTRSHQSRNQTLSNRSSRSNTTQFIQVQKEVIELVSDRMSLPGDRASKSTTR